MDPQTGQKPGCELNVQNVAICKCLMRHYSCVLLMKDKQCFLHALNANLRNLKTHNFDGNLIFACFLFRLFYCTTYTSFFFFIDSKCKFNKTICGIFVTI